MLYSKIHYLSIKIMEEYFDIVDENNQPLNFQISRKEAHANLIHWHRTTHIWIVNSNREILCQKRSIHKDADPGVWQSFFGGHLKAGQTYGENVISEIEEELGLVVDKANLSEIKVTKSERSKHFGKIYLYKWSGYIVDVHFNDGEVDEVKLIDLDTLKKEIMDGQYANKMDDEIFNYINKSIP